LCTIQQKAFSDCWKLGPSIQLPAALEAIPAECFRQCGGLSVITFEQNSSVRAIREKAFDGCPLKSFRIGASVVAVDCSCFSPSAGAVDVTFESPAHVREILNFRPCTGVEAAIPNSVEVLEIAADRGWICNFGVDSRLQCLRFAGRDSKRVGFLRVSKGFLKRRRAMMEWANTAP
jgi:hypothetical protein